MSSGASDENRDSAATGSQPARTGRTAIVVRIVGCLVVLGILIALLLPAIQSPRVQTRSGSSINNLKQIGLGLLQYHSAKQSLPAAAKQDDAGNPLLSWRVAILPFLDGFALFEEFDQDESWNGPHNRPWINKEPDFYVSPKATDNRTGESNIFAIVGPDTAMMPDRGVKLAEITDATSRTIMAVELTGSGVMWSEPRDITIDEFIAAMQRKPSDTGLRPLYSNGAYCVFADGAVHLIPIGTPPETLRAMCTRAGGEQVAVPEF